MQLKVILTVILSGLAAATPGTPAKKATGAKRAAIAALGPRACDCTKLVICEQVIEGIIAFPGASDVVAKSLCPIYASCNADQVTACNPPATCDCNTLSVCYAFCNLYATVPGGQAFCMNQLCPKSVDCNSCQVGCCSTPKVVAAGCPKCPKV